MEPMRARRAPKWQLSVATAFARLRERCLELDTIPKPGGLDSGGRLDGLAFQGSSSIFPATVQVLSNLSSRSGVIHERQISRRFEWY